MIPEREAVANAYLEHLTTADLDLLLAGAPSAPDDPLGRRSLVRAHPGGVEELLARPQAFDAVFGPAGGAEPFVSVSPFLAFAVAVQRVAVELQSASYVSEWLGPGVRTPVFDVAELRDFLAAPRRRLFLAELLASYTHVASGSVVVQTRRGWRRQRFSELDPVRLAGLLEVVSEAELPGVLRRLGDVALFLTGVFPDHTARQGFGPVEETRLLRAGGLSRPTGRQAEPAGAGAVGAMGAVGLLEQLGRRWYRGAFELLPRPVPGNVAVLGELPERFGQARRILNLVTERFLFRYRDRWFGAAG
ncbi:MAG TPA: hypothetical protein VMU75_02095 [Acidimicrobiales bacterium]|nr:hypothetical protein [Acidimicrobiales bacterium]